MCDKLELNVRNRLSHEWIVDLLRHILDTLHSYEGYGKIQPCLNPESVLLSVSDGNNIAAYKPMGILADYLVCRCNLFVTLEKYSKSTRLPPYILAWKAINVSRVDQCGNTKEVAIMATHLSLLATAMTFVSAHSFSFRYFNNFIFLFCGTHSK